MTFMARRVFRNADYFPIIGILLFSTLVSSFALDRVYRGESTIITNSCNGLGFTQIFTNKESCANVERKAELRGWPIIVNKTEINSRKPQVRWQNSIALQRDVYLTANMLLLTTLSIAGYVLVRPKLSLKLSKGQKGTYPIISASDFLSESGLVSMHQESFDGYKLNLLTNRSGRVMLNITLPKNTKLHLLAFGKLGETSLAYTQNISSDLQKIVLEGDFPSYFNIYCTKGRQNEVLRILEPVTMQYLAKFCKSYELELYNEVLYVSKAEDAQDSSDNTTLVQDTKHLLSYHGKRLLRMADETNDHNRH
jgi:hypothetical protein